MYIALTFHRTCNSKRYFFHSDSNDRIKKLEEEKSSTPSQGSQPTPLAHFQPHLQPKGLDFNTPQSAKQPRVGSLIVTPSTPATPQQSSDRMSDVESLSSENTNTSVTPDMQKLSLGKPRGRPRKPLVGPNMDDFPYGASEEEQRKYIRKKNTERWRYNKLIGSDAATYRQSEINRVNTYNKKKKKDKGDDSPEDTDSDRQKKLSRAR